MWCMLWLMLGVGYPECWAHESPGGLNRTGYICSHIDDALGYTPECHAIFGPDCEEGAIVSSRGECIWVEWPNGARHCYDEDLEPIECEESPL